MKPIFLKKNTRTPLESFYSIKKTVPHIYDKWHIHKEFELLYIVEGTGTRYMGDNIESFGPGNIILTGPNLPHGWKSDPEYYVNEELNVTAILVHFSPDFLDEFLLLPEMKKVQTMLSAASHGIKFSEPTTRVLDNLLEKLVIAKDVRRIILFLEILDTMSQDEFHPLASNFFSQSFQEQKDSKINKIYEYIMTNFDQKISLEDLAQVANMNSTSLCRYFKTSTKKTLTDFINEIRIGYAFDLLNTKNYSVTEACFESGFNSLSYFNRQFKKIMGSSPLQLKSKISHLSSFE